MRGVLPGDQERTSEEGDGRSLGTMSEDRAPTFAPVDPPLSRRCGRQHPQTLQALSGRGRGLVRAPGLGLCWNRLSGAAWCR